MRNERQIMTEGYLERADVWTILDLIVAEFISEPMSVQCFDAGIVARAIELNLQHKGIVNTNKPQNVMCPECGGEMVSRTGKYGTFWGCKKFPECKGTRDSMGRSKQDRENEKAGIVEEYPQEHGFPFRRIR